MSIDTLWDPDGAGRTFLLVGPEGELHRVCPLPLVLPAPEAAMKQPDFLTIKTGFSKAVTLRQKS